MTWKISELIQALKDQEVEMAAKDGEMDRLVLQKLMRLTKDRRYRRKKAAQNLQRVRAVAEELHREAAQDIQRIPTLSRRGADSRGRDRPFAHQGGPANDLLPRPELPAVDGTIGASLQDQAGNEARSG